LLSRLLLPETKDPLRNPENSEKVVLPEENSENKENSENPENPENLENPEKVVNSVLPSSSET